MCGVHNCTQNLHITDLERFTIRSTSGKNDAIIYMPMPRNVPNDPENIGNRTYTFTNVITVKIEDVTIFFISLNFIGKNSTFEADYVDFHGYSGFSSSLVSVINITNSQAVLKDCIFQHNCFIKIQSNAVLQVSNCAFSSYSHALYSAIFVDNSTLKLTGTVTFFNNTVGNDQYYVCGGAISINSGGKCKGASRSIFSITKAYVIFNSNSASSCGGGFYLECTLITAFDNVSMIFVNNVVKSKYNYYGSGGGAMYLIKSDIIVNNSVIQFLNNSAKGVADGGAIYQTQSNVYISEHGAIRFVNNSASSLGGAIYHRNGDVISVDKHSKILFYNNSASQGGALYIQLSGIIQVSNDSRVKFSHNTAKKFGGAVYAYDQACLFSFESSSSEVLFRENVAKDGVGMHVYGASIKNLGCAKHDCREGIVRYIPSLNSSLSPVSSNPKRVCLCDLNGKPQCANISSMFVNWYRVYRGELFNISAVVVGYDFGVTVGTVNAGILPSQKQSKSALHPDQYHQFLGSSGRVQCSNISYSLYSSNTGESLHEALSLHTSSVDIAYSFGKRKVTKTIQLYEDSHHTCIDIDLLTAPVLVNITLLAGCPPGFTLILVNQLYGCNCYPVLQNNHNFECFIIDNEGYLKWKSTVWVNATFNKYNVSESDGILLARYCPVDYCKSGEKIVNLDRDPNAQCANNHAGILCGGCETNYSLAIGSSRCIRCSNDSHLSVFMFFIAAGILLVIFILALNLTVTEGLINGLILYANTLWTFKNILFPFKQILTVNVFYTFIAWLNLDFGIETCLVVGLTAFWKTWLQFLFPLYIWLIAGIIIIACRHSSHLTNLIGDRAVPLLATLFLLSYTKLIRTATAIFEFEVLILYPNQTSKSIVWYLDGSLQYCKHPHIYLFLAGLASLIFCLTVTLFLLLIQCWRRVSHLRLLRWINKFTPFYDAYFAPLKDKHHYWFGTLLVVRITHLIFFTVTSSTSPLVGLLLLQFSLALLFFYLSIQNVYKSKLVRILEGAALLNLTILFGSTTYTRSEKALFMEISIAFSLIQFTVIIITNLSRIICKRNHKCLSRNGYQVINQEIDSGFMKE